MIFADFYTSIYSGYFALIVLVLITWFSVLIAKKYFDHKFLFRNSALTVFLITYVFIVLSNLCIEWYLDSKLDSFDLNGDGVFSDGENTREQAIYMSLVMNDTGRTFAPITGFFYSLVYSVVFYCGFRIVAFINNRLKLNTRNKGIK